MSKETNGGGHKVCPHCFHFKTCRVPCYPVAEYLKKDNLSVFERSETDENGQTVTLLFSRSREVPESALRQKSRDIWRPVHHDRRVFNTDQESPFAAFVPNLKQTGVFVDRFFHGFSYEDLAVKYEMSSDNARKTFHNAVERIHEVLKLMDR